jgi:hypothetical protein
MENFLKNKTFCKTKVFAKQKFLKNNFFCKTKVFEKQKLLLNPNSPPPLPCLPTTVVSGLLSAVVGGVTRDLIGGRRAH